MTQSQLISLIIYILVGPLAWGLILLLILPGRRQMQLLRKPYRPLPADVPRVTVLVPAKDEALRIESCLDSVLRQDYPDFELIAVDDRSTDGTAEIIDRMAAGHPRMTAVHIVPGSLPPGWTGKCNALQTAVVQARGEWLLFVDSDVILEPNALSATVARSIAHHYDCFSLILRLETHGFWEQLLLPTAGAALSMMQLVALSNKDYIPNVAFANGQFLLIRREVYDAIGGHAAVHNAYCEDLALARILKSTGRKLRVSWGTDLAAVRMYDSLPAIRRGWARLFYAAARGRLWPILYGILNLLTWLIMPVIAFVVAGQYFATGRPAPGYVWLIAAIAQIALTIVALGMMYRWSGNKPRYAWLWPLSFAMLLNLFWGALRIRRTGNLEWRGTQYTPQQSMTP